MRIFWEFLGVVGCGFLGFLGCLFVGRFSFGFSGWIRRVFFRIFIMGIFVV